MRSYNLFNWYSKSSNEYYKVVYQKYRPKIIDGRYKYNQLSLEVTGIASEIHDNTIELPVFTALNFDKTTTHLPELQKNVFIRISYKDFEFFRSTIPSSTYDYTAEECRYIDLAKDEQSLKRNLRKSYKSLVNKADNISITKPERLNSVISQAQLLHKQLAGRATRHNDSWGKMAEAVLNGDAILVDKTIDDVLIGYCFFFHNKKNAYYVSSAIQERKGNHPLMWCAILHLKSIGVEKLILEFSSDRRNQTEKEIAIKNFKDGFSPSVLKTVKITL